MSNINTALISGNLTRDAELRVTNSGMQVLRFGVAVNDRRKNQQTGDWEDVPNFIDCVMFGRRAEGIAQYLTKGTKVAICGRLSWSSWQDNETGKNRSKVEVIVDDLEFMSRGQGGFQQQPPRQPMQQQAYQQQPVQQQFNQQPPQEPAYQSAYADDDIPF